MPSAEMGLIPNTIPLLLEEPHRPAKGESITPRHYKPAVLLTGATGASVRLIALEFLGRLAHDEFVYHVLEN